MQLHGPSEPIDSIPVEPYGTSGNVALKLPAHMWLVLTSPQDADRLIIAATQAKDLMLVTQPQNDPPMHLGWHASGDPACDLCDDDPHPDGELMPRNLAAGYSLGPVEPFPHLPHLPQHVGGNPMCTLCGLDHYALHAIEQTSGDSA